VTACFVLIMLIHVPRYSSSNKQIYSLLTVDVV
jgi:hypothetical protein